MAGTEETKEATTTLAEDEEMKKVNNLMSYLSVVKEIEDIPVASAATLSTHWSEEEENWDEEGKLLKKPYNWVMRRYWSAKFPSMCLDSIDLQEESIFTVADEVFKSHIFNVRCALEAMQEKQAFIVWIDYDFFRIKDHSETIKVSCDKYEPGKGKQLKARKYHYWKNQGISLALSPAVQGFRFERDGFIKRHGLELKTGNFNFVHLNRDVRYVEMNSARFFDEPFKTMEIEYFLKPTQVVSTDIQKRRKEEMELNLPDVDGHQTKN